MDTNPDKELVRRFWQAMWTPDPAAALAPLVAPDLAFRGTFGMRAQGPKGVADYVAAVSRAFPDYAASIEELIAEGDRVVARLRFTGTHQGPALGYPATGRTVEYTGLALARVKDGVIHEMWVVGDTIGLVDQLKGD